MKLIGLDRRQFIASAGGAVLLGTACREAAGASAAASAGPVELGPWIAIDADDAVIVRIAKSEIGQGVFTSNAMMICEELGCDWSKVRAEFVDVNRDVKENNLYGQLRTTAANSALTVRAPLQRVGAVAREQLKAAAAARWGVPASEISARDSVLTHEATGRRMRFAEAVADAARVRLDHEPTVKQPKHFVLMGTRVARLDTVRKVRGEPVFAIDMRLPNMVYASVRMSPRLGDRLASHDFDKVRDMPGVIASVPLRGVGGRDSIAIIADSWWRAESALRRMPISWTAAEKIVSSDEVSRQANALSQTLGVKLVETGAAAQPDEPGLRQFSAVYETPMQTHAPLETVNCTAKFDVDRLDVWAGSQGPDDALIRAAKAASVSPENVYVHTTFVGGGFGSRTPRGEIEQAVVLAKTVAGRPVKVIWPREQEMTNNEFHPIGVTACRASLKSDGDLRELSMTKAGDVAGKPGLVGPFKAKVNEQNCRSIYDLPYGADATRVDVHDMRSGLPVGIWRSVGDYHNVFAIESFVEELAREAGDDPLAYRRRLLQNGSYWNRAYWIQTLDRLAEAARWGAKLPRGEGMGIAISDHRRPGRTDSSICAVAAKVTIPKSGALIVDRVHIVFESGLGLINPVVVEQQLRGQVAWSLGSIWQAVNVTGGVVSPKNYDDYPMVRMADMPREITIDYLPTDRWNQGVGEMLVPMMPPAISNAIHAAIGKRFRRMPLSRTDLSWT